MFALPFNFMKATLHLFSTIILLILLIAGSGCANMMPPSGGPRDSLPPRLVSATPPDSARNVRTNRITFTFDEFVEVQGATEQLIVSPTLNNIPTVESRLRTVTIKLRDTLEPNTTYSFNFGNAIRDVNEGNVMKNFTYVFSTGNRIDRGTLAGKVFVAETGKVDSTLIIVLHQNLSDTAILRLRARYYTRVDGQGNFQFNNLPAGSFNVYAVPGSASNFYRQYQDTTDLFAFLNQPVSISDTSMPVSLYAFRQTLKTNTTTSPTNRSPATTPRNATGKRLRYSTNLEGTSQDLLSPLVLAFETRIAQFDSSSIQLTDTAFRPLTGYSLSFDSTRTKLMLINLWQENTGYKLIIPKTAIADSAGTTLAKNDTLSFTTKRERDYGSIKLRFSNIDASKNPVLQLVQNDVVVESIIITQREWTRKLYKPGEYELRVLYDTNKNGVWDTGNYFKKLQPEIVKPLDRRLNIKANWDNEVDITL